MLDRNAISSVKKRIRVSRAGCFRVYMGFGPVVDPRKRKKSMPDNKPATATSVASSTVPEPAKIRFRKKIKEKIPKPHPRDKENFNSNCSRREVCFGHPRHTSAQPVSRQRSAAANARTMDAFA